MSNIAEKVKL